MWDGSARGGFLGCGGIGEEVVIRSNEVGGLYMGWKL